MQHPTKKFAFAWISTKYGNSDKCKKAVKNIKSKLLEVIFLYNERNLFSGCTLL